MVATPSYLDLSDAGHELHIYLLGDVPAYIPGAWGGEIVD